MVTKFGVFLGHMGHWVPRERLRTFMSSSISFVPPFFPHRSTLFISWALVVSPRTTIPILLSLHVVIGPAPQRDLYPHGSERSWLAHLGLGSCLRSTPWWTKSGVTEYKPVFRGHRCCFLCFRIGEAIHREGGLTVIWAKVLQGAYQPNPISRTAPILPHPLSNSFLSTCIFHLERLAKNKQTDRQTKNPTKPTDS